MNRLASSTSPYLLQHKDNPIDWWPWGDEAFAEAKRRDVPVLISIGYAACHWCHVMAHESFDDEQVAAAVNDTVVAIKVDREERPDVDSIYMAATQAMLRGQGGWPMTVFATPDGEPFLCGTYFRRDDFLQLVDVVGRAWREQRDLVLRQGGALVEAIRHLQAGGVAEGAITAETADAAISALAGRFDDTYGGFGHAPKFPPHMTLVALLRHYQRVGDPRALEMARHTCEAMARGGINDQLAGGFARYAVDETWLVPHFEKMLYDNALLLRVYTLLWQITGDPLAARVAAQTAGFLVDEMHVDGGGFISSLDADTAGVEGATYVWTPAQLRETLGEADGDWAADLFGVTDAGTFERGTSVLRLCRDVDGAPEEITERWRRVRRILAQARRDRPQPGRDEKVIAAWNGLAITALIEFALQVDAAEAGTVEAMTGAAAAARRAAEQAATYVQRRHIVDGRLRRASRDGVVGAPDGVLEDYGCVAEAFLALHQSTTDGAWLDAASGLLHTATTRFARSDGGFFDTADDAQRLVVRPADPTDNATPAGLTAIAAALVTHSALADETSHRDIAERALATIAGTMGTFPDAVGHGFTTAQALLAGPHGIAVADPAGDSELARSARRLAPAGAVVVVGPPNHPGVPLLRGRALIDGRPTAYVCRGFVCDRPVTSVGELAELLGRRLD